MTRTFKSIPLPMHRDFVSKQLMGTIINQHRKEKQAQLQKFQHIGRKLDIIAIPTSIYSSLIIIFSSIMNEFNNITSTQIILFMIYKHRKFTTLHISKILLMNNSGSKLNKIIFMRGIIQLKTKIMMTSFMVIIILIAYKSSQ